MTRYHAAMRLLEHGPLSFAEFLAITGWKAHAEWVLLALVDNGLVSAEPLSGAVESRSRVRQHRFHLLREAAHA